MASKPPKSAYGNQPAKERFVKWLLARRTRGEMNPLGARFASDRLRWLEHPAALERVEWHRVQGHRLGLLTASLREYLEPRARSQGWDELICTGLEYQQDRATGRLAGRNVQGFDKVRRMQEGHSDWAVREAWAYGDSRPDQPLLNLATHAEFRPFRPANWRSLALNRTGRCLR
jgi:HAD superfamily phosphoserine phosphatase-like hydrolase